MAQGRAPVLVAWNKRRNCLHPLKQEWIGHVAPASMQTRRWLPFQTLANPRNWPAWITSLGMDHRTPLPLHPAHRPRLAGAWLLMPEQMEGDVARRMTAFARRSGMQTAAIFHDAIPLLHPELTQRSREAHQSYLDALGAMDLVLAVSGFSARSFQKFLTHDRRAPVRTVPLPAEIPGIERVRIVPPSGNPLKILCVSTLEPRKNHRVLIAAFEQACAGCPELPMELHLAGDRFEGAPDIAEYVSQAEKRNPAIHWHRNASPETLKTLYLTSDFTVYPSILEGFGMPVMESLWCARPCLCAHFGVMAENAAGGGCLTVDVRDSAALAEALLALATRPGLREKLAMEAVARPLRTWADYAADIAMNLSIPENR
jgi:glycosyltransferase involved in cell wall biosynthesis